MALASLSPGRTILALGLSSVALTLVLVALPLLAPLV
jgi:hypothetical protein